jgi:hypothetical protein
LISEFASGPKNVWMANSHSICFSPGLIDEDAKLEKIRLNELKKKQKLRDETKKRIAEEKRQMAGYERSYMDLADKPTHLP